MDYGFLIGLLSYRTFPSSQKVPLDSATIKTKSQRPDTDDLNSYRGRQGVGLVLREAGMNQMH